jgi:PAS domain S-box-containing protein
MTARDHGTPVATSALQDFPSGSVTLRQQRILILAPTGNDARLTADFLSEAAMRPEICPDMTALCERIREGCGAIILAEEALGAESMQRLAEVLLTQPSWSDLPITIIKGGRAQFRSHVEDLADLAPGSNITILERPFRLETLIRNAEVSLRSRERQYQVRDLLAESRRREKALRESEARFRKMSDSAPVMIWLAGLDKKFSWLNTAWLRFTGRSLEDELGDGWTSRIHPDDFSHTWQIYTAAFDAREEFQMEYRLRRSDGAWRWLLAHGVPLYAADHDLTGYIGSCVDITERKETLAELETLVAERTATLRETIGDLEAFSYTVSHDLRAPLRAVQGYAQILKEEYKEAVLDEVAEDYLDRIIKAGNRLDGLIQDVLAYSRVARRDHSMHSVELDPLVRDIVRQYPQLRAPDVQVSIRGRLPAVKGCEALLTQCFSNLLGNAAKFVKPGQPAQIVLHAEKSLGSTVRLWIEDSGIGIAPEHQERIFGMFERLEQKNYEGTGVGLAIARKAVERMEGKIGVISELGKGSSFWIELPTG